MPLCFGCICYLPWIDSVVQINSFRKFRAPILACLFTAHKDFCGPFSNGHGDYCLDKTNPLVLTIIDIWTFVIRTHAFRSLCHLPLLDVQTGHIITWTKFALFRFIFIRTSVLFVLVSALASFTIFNHSLMWHSPPPFICRKPGKFEH